MPVDPREVASTLIERQRASALAASVRRAEILARLTEKIRGSISDGRVERAWLIGSLAWGGFGVRSDVDVVVRGAKPESAARFCDELTALVGCHVELLRFEELPVAFQERVLREGVALP